MQLEINAFINAYPDWEERLAQPPYSVKAKRDGGFVLLKYEQFRSDFSIPLVRECRGIILDEAENYRPVCIPFFKFGNFGESYVPEIDWGSARVQEKLDGSLIKLWHCRGKWHISSNGEIDARNARISSALLTNTPTTDLFTLFMEAWEKTGIRMEGLNKDFTYMFELTSPHNRVVVQYHETKLWHIGARDNKTLLECEVDIGIPKPRVFALSTLEECIESAKQLDYSEEGYVIVDRHFNRIKVKSPAYVALNHISQGTTTHANVIEIIQKNEQDEFLTYFPEFKQVFDDILTQIESFAERQTIALEKIQAETFESRKELAEIVTKTECPPCLFALIDGKETNARDWLLSRPAAKVLGYIGFLE